MAGTEPFGGKPDRGTTDRAAQGSEHGSATRDKASTASSDTDVGKTISRTRDTLMEEGRERIGEARGHLHSLLHQQTGRAADRLSNVAEALHMAAQKMADENGESTVARYTDSAAQRVDGLANMLRDATIDDVMSEVEGFARRRPEVFVGAAMAAGFLFARFLKSADQGFAARGRGMGLLGQRPDRNYRGETGRSSGPHWSDRSYPAQDERRDRQHGWDRPEAGERAPGQGEHSLASRLDRDLPVTSGPGSRWPATSVPADKPAGAVTGQGGGGAGFRTGNFGGGSLRPAPARPASGSPMASGMAARPDSPSDQKTDRAADRPADRSTGSGSGPGLTRDTDK